MALSFLDVLGEDLLVLSFELLGFLVAVELFSLEEGLSSESLLGNESLDVGGLVESLVTLLDLAAHNVLSHVVLLAEGEHLSDVAGSLGAESAGLVVSGDTFDLSISLLENSEGDHGKIGAADAAADGLSLSLTSSSWSVGCGLYI